MTAVIVVPVLGRPERIQPLVSSLRSTTDAPMVFVCSPNDRDALIECNATGERVIVTTWEPERADFSRKTNLAFRETKGEWVFCGATDLLFHPLWLENAIRVGDRVDAGVVGTQDMGNPLVKRGVHATHPLVRRSYIQEQGGTFDRSGEIYSEQYQHQYVDLELCEIAKARGQWAFAKNSVVEHLHPAWGKAPVDATYEKAFKDVREDRVLFQHRMRQFKTRHTRNRRRAAL